MSGARAAFDVLIVGAGSAGCVLAARLTQDSSLRVGLLEAGAMPADPDIGDPRKWPFLQGRPFDWAYLTAPQPGTAGRRHPWPRGRVVGGSSCLHAMAHVRGHPDDFEPWARAAGSRLWSYDGLLPAFRRSEAFSGADAPGHGLDGPMPVYLPHEEVSPLVRAYMAAGLALGAPDLGDHNNGRTLTGVAPNSLTIRDGRRVSAADAWLTSDVLARPNLRLFTGVLVERLVLDGRRAASVEVRHGGGAETLSAGVVILSAGAVASPLLLMRSGIGPEDVLAAAGVPCRLALPGVGANLHDHLLAANLYRARRPVPPSRLQHSESLMYLHSGDLRRPDGAPDIALACVAAPSASECFEAPPPGEAYTILFGVTHPTSRGRIAITGPDLAHPPLIDPAYLSTPQDRATFREALRLAREVGRHAALAPWRAEELLPGPSIFEESDIDVYVARAAITHHHPVGTCIMGLGEGAVVDAGLTLHGLDNLHVVDASVIPAITSGPVHAAVLAIAETFAEGAAFRAAVPTDLPASAEAAI